LAIVFIAANAKSRPARAGCRRVLDGMPCLKKEGTYSPLISTSVAMH
jgi:hypothetical protein